MGGWLGGCRGLGCVVDEGAAICCSSIPGLHMAHPGGCPVLCGAPRGVRSRGGKRPALRHVLAAAAAAAAGAARSMYWPGLL